MSSSISTNPPPLSGDNYTTTAAILNLGLGYSIAIALAFLILLSAIILASYICCRTSQNNNSRSSELIIVNRRLPVPRIVFVGDGEDDTERNSFVGLGPAIINSYPKFVYNKDRLVNVNIDSICSICLCEYKDLEMLRMLPDCRHCFHLSCVDVWLKLNASCPVCRSSPMPTPMSTPLSEVVPLSGHDGGRRNFR